MVFIVKKIMLFLVMFSYTVELSAKIGYGFIENRNQWLEHIDYIITIPGGKMVVQEGGFGYYFFDYNKINALHSNYHDVFKESRASTASNLQIDARYVRVDFLGYNPLSAPKASKRSDTYFNYFLGNDPKLWASKAYAFDEVRYNDFYPGIDLVLNTMGDNIKYDLVVGAEVDPTCIRIKYSGTSSLSIIDKDLMVDADLVCVTEKAPISYQVINGVKKNILTEYVLVGNQLSFTFPDGYDPCYELVIDPLLIFSTYSGFTADNWGSSATPGENGTLYSSGTTSEELIEGSFDVTPGAFQTKYGGGGFDIGLFKYDSLGQKLLYASYLGGTSVESPHSLLVNNNEDLLVLGTTGSADFPITQGAHDSSFGGGSSANSMSIVYGSGADIFISKFSKDGTKLLASTYLGGSGNDGINSELAANYGDEMRGDIITDQNDDIFIASVTSSQDFGAINSFSTTYKGGGSDALIVKLSSNLDQMYWAAFLGGRMSESAYSIKLDQTQGSLLIAGATSSTDFPTTQGAYNEDYDGNIDAVGWIAKLLSDGTAIKASTYVAPSGYNQAYFVDLNNQGEVYIYGQTGGAFLVTQGVYSNPNSGQFLQKYTNDLSTLLYSTTFGSGRGTIDISPTAFLVNGQCGNIYMSGWGGDINLVNSSALSEHVFASSTIGMPITFDAFQRSTLGSDFYMIVLSDDASKLLYGTFMGGSSNIHVDGGTSRFDKRGIVYHAVCAGCGGIASGFPSTTGAWSETNNSKNCNNAAFKFDLSTLHAYIVTNSLELDQPNIRQVCLPEATVVFQNKSIGGEYYEWDFGDGTTEVRIYKDDIEHKYSKIGTYKVTLKAVDRQTCIGEDIDVVTIRIDNPIGSAGADYNICYGQRALLEAKGGVSYEWKIENKEPFSFSPKTYVDPQDTTSYIVTITDVQQCVVSDTVTISVIPKLDIQFDLSLEYDCNSRIKIKLTNQTAPDGNILFDFGDGNTSMLDEVLHDYERDGYYNIKIVGKKEFCTYEKSVNIPVLTIKVPNVITPLDSEELNDTFKIIYGDQLASEAGINVSLSIYNRWGKSVYKNMNYQDDWAAKGLTAGVYYYKLKLNYENDCRGWVQVIK